MAMNSRERSLVAALQALKAELSSRGWEDAPRANRTVLVMTRTPSPGVCHKLMVNEPLSKALLPSDGLLGLSLTANVSFENLEEVVSCALGRDAASSGKLSAGFALCQLMPEGSCHLGVRLVDPERAEGVQGLINDYVRYLAPVLQRMESESVLADEQTIPPTVNPWTWALRRLAYLYLRAGKEDTRKYCDLLEELGRERLDGHTPGVRESAFLAGAAEARERGDARSAEDARRMATVVRSWLRS